MSDASEKPFEATPQRIAKAKREGDVARSGELPANAAFAAAILACIAVTPPIAIAAKAAMARAATGGADVPALLAILAYAATPLAAAAGGAATAAIVQSGGVTLIAPSPKFKRIDPVAGIKRTFSRETLAHSARGALAFILAIGATVVPATIALSRLVQAATPQAAAAAVWIAVRQIALAACAIGTAFAVVEYLAARRTWLRRLRMSFEERKREIKDQEGDPFARSRRRTLARSMLRGSLRKVRDAAFVVANPTHVAIALEYRPPAVAVPRVVVRACDAAALRVRALAEQAGIPVIENVPLARALYEQSDAGQPIPYALYVAVAEIVAALMREGRLNA